MALIVTPRQLNQRAEFYQQLASLLSAGVALIQAFEILLRTPPAAAFRETLARLIRSITEGATLSESLLTLGRWAPSFDLALIQAAEQSGRLPECFRLLAHYYAERSQLARRVMADLAYPAFLVFLALLVFPTTRLTGLDEGEVKGRGPAAQGEQGFGEGGALGDAADEPGEGLAEGGGRGVAKEDFEGLDEGHSGAEQRGQLLVELRALIQLPGRDDQCHTPRPPGPVKRPPCRGSPSGRACCAVRRLARRLRRL